MNIPKKIKVGGKTYAVGVTDRLALGCNYDAEILYNDLQINLRPGAREHMVACLLHELFHALLDHLGIKEHDEQLVDGLAQSLHMVIRDNPRLFAPETPAKTTRKTGKQSAGQSTSPQD